MLHGKQAFFTAFFIMLFVNFPVDSEIIKNRIVIKETDKIVVIGSFVDDKKYQETCKFSLTEEQVRFFIKNAVITPSYKVNQSYVWAPCYVKGKILTQNGTYEWIIREIDIGCITTPDGKSFWLTCDGFDYYLSESGKNDEKLGHGLMIQDFNKFYHILKKAIKECDKKTVGDLLSRTFEYYPDNEKENYTHNKIIDALDYDLVGKMLSYGYTEPLPGKYAFSPAKEKRYLTDGYLMRFYNYGKGWKVIEITQEPMP